MSAARCGVVPVLRSSVLAHRVVLASFQLTTLVPSLQPIILALALAHPDELAETLRKELLPVKEAAVQLNVPAIPVLIVLETPKREVTVSTALWVGQDGNVAPYTEGQFEKPIPPPLPPFNYHEYLRSPQWKEKRKAALARANYRCLMCNSPDNLDVHHRTYKNIGNEREEDLAVLCRTCHDIF
jgi:hypothetical protein